MSTKTTIQKILLAAVWLAVGAGLLMLLVAAIGKKSRQQCSDYIITIKSTQDDLFMNKNDVLKLVMAATNGKIKGQPMSSFNLMRLETFLEHSVWIKDAELYFDNQNVLHISVKERQPVARLFTVSGASFYIDSHAVRIPLSANISARVPVFTNFPEPRAYNIKDSLLLADIKQLAAFIAHDPFWMAQIAQVDITSQRTFEMIPTIGNHLIKFGDAKNMDEKFHRLFVFYRQVLSKTGFDKYSVIDVQYAGQIVGTKRNISKGYLDSLQAKYDAVKFMQEVQEREEEKANMIASGDEEKTEMNSSAGADKLSAPAKTKTIKLKEPVSQKKKEKPKPHANNVSEKNNEHRTPKAIMPKRN